jgi:hypothetical protein
MPEISHFAATQYARLRAALTTVVNGSSADADPTPLVLPSAASPSALEAQMSQSPLPPRRTAIRTQTGSGQPVAPLSPAQAASRQTVLQRAVLRGEPDGLHVVSNRLNSHVTWVADAAYGVAQSTHQYAGLFAAAGGFISGAGLRPDLRQAAQLCGVVLLGLGAINARHRPVTKAHVLMQTLKQPVLDSSGADCTLPVANFLEATRVVANSPRFSLLRPGASLFVEQNIKTLARDPSALKAIANAISADETQRADGLQALSENPAFQALQALMPNPEHAAQILTERHSPVALPAAMTTPAA